VGLGLPQEVSRKLITQAGHALRDNSVEDIIYTRIISGIISHDIHAINAVIDELAAKYPEEKIRKLGSQTYDGQNNYEE